MARVERLAIEAERVAVDFRMDVLLVAAFLVVERFAAFFAGARFVTFFAGARLVTFLAGARLVTFLAGARLVTFLAAFFAGARFATFLAAFFAGARLAAAFFATFLAGARLAGALLAAAFLAGAFFAAFLAAVRLAAAFFAGVAFLRPGAALRPPVTISVASWAIFLALVVRFVMDLAVDLAVARAAETADFVAAAAEPGRRWVVAALVTAFLRVGTVLPPSEGTPASTGPYVYGRNVILAWCLWQQRGLPSSVDRAAFRRLVNHEGQTIFLIRG
ncbi:hypothetical protein [Actinopolymorpha alba]|uniref:hypothetical protein n=1 Tax=Actinopolymorpha alba TaxID=533267 RepID=UPI00192CB103|nr:hypothetical protein [Actinopolymorpha alba]